MHPSIHTLAGTPLRRYWREARPSRPTARLLSLIAGRAEPQKRGRRGLVALDRRGVAPQRTAEEGSPLGGLGVSDDAGRANARAGRGVCP